MVNVLGCTVGTCVGEDGVAVETTETGTVTVDAIVGVVTMGVVTSGTNRV